MSEIEEWDPDRKYEEGDLVFFDGNVWLAQRATRKKEKPGHGPAWLWQHELEEVGA